MSLKEQIENLFEEVEGINTFERYKANYNPPIITEGHIYYNDGVNEYVKFYDNEYGRYLESLWNKLNEPLRG